VIDAEGSISISLLSLTTIGCLLINGFLLACIYLNCSNAWGDCSWVGIVPDLPSISSCICHPFVDRVCMFVFTFFSLTVFQTDMRAIYKNLHGKVSKGQNEGMLVLGVLTTISLPCIAYFDMHNYGFFHYVFAITFFGTCFFYIWFVVGFMVKYKDQFRQEDQRPIRQANRFRWIMLASAVFYGYTKLFYDTHSDFYEWVIVFMYLNALSIINLTNDFIDTVVHWIPKPATEV